MKNKSPSTIFSSPKPRKNKEVPDNIESQNKELAKVNSLPKSKNKTISLSHKLTKNDWFLIDANNVTLGRLAAFIAVRLKGKHKPDYTPHVSCGDKIIIINAEKIHVTGNKENDKKYYNHTGYVGGIKERTVRMIRNGKNPGDLVKRAVKGMLSRGPLARKILKNMYVYVGHSHPHEAQSPVIINFKELSYKNGAA